MKKITIAFLALLFGGITIAQNQIETPATLAANEAEISTSPVYHHVIKNPEQGVDGRGVMSTIDVDQPEDIVFMAGFYQGDLAQSFIPTASDICGAGIAVFLPSGGSQSGDITISLWDNLPNAGGIQLATGTTSATLSATPAFVDVSWTSIPVTPGTTYYLVFTTTNSSFGIRGSTVNPYTDGMVFANSGYAPFPGFDYTFHTFTCGGVAVPVSNWAIVLGVLMIGTFIVIRYRRERLA